MTSFNDLAQANRDRQAQWGGGSNIDLAFRGLELGGEAGEVLEVVEEIANVTSTAARSVMASGKAQNKLKKLVRILNGIQGTSEGKHELLQDLSDELADMVICASLLANDLDIDLGEAVANKFNKTSKKVGIKVYL